MPDSVAFQCPRTFYDSFDRKGQDPGSTHYCPGCGHGVIHKLVAEAIDDFDAQDRTILVSPVGCSVFAYYYFDVGNVQAPHGRSPAVATAIKRACPDSLVLDYQGDGDLAAIGGNEILQAANRGENLTVFFVNNAIYGMTGGQMAPTTLLDMKTTTTPEGRTPANEGFPLRVCELLATLDAPYYLERVAIGDSRHNSKVRRAVRKAIRYQLDNKGFSLVEVLSPCPTGWKRTPVEAAAWTIDQMTKTFPVGVYRDGHDRDLGHPRYRRHVEASSVPEILGVEAGAGNLPLPDDDLGIDEARFKFAGFGGQGVLLMGLVTATAGMLAKRQVSWMPSYGPEMRGGTAYCAVTVSDRAIGSPLIEHPTVLVVMNEPSLYRFERDVVVGGHLFYNASLIDRKPARRDVEVVAVPANEIADKIGDAAVANMVMLGAVLARDRTVSLEAVRAALPRALKSRPDLAEIDLRAVEAGYEAFRESSLPA